MGGDNDISVTIQLQTEFIDLFQSKCMQLLKYRLQIVMKCLIYYLT